MVLSLRRFVLEPSVRDSRSPLPNSRRVVEVLSSHPIIRTSFGSPSLRHPTAGWRVILSVFLHSLDDGPMESMRLELDWEIITRLARMRVERNGMCWVEDNNTPLSVLRGPRIAGQRRMACHTPPFLFGYHARVAYGELGGRVM